MAYFLGFFRRIALFGVIALLVCMLCFGVKFPDVYEASFRLCSFQDCFFAFLFYSLFVFIVFEIISIIYWLKKPYSEGLIYEFLSGIGNDITYPFFSIFMFIKHLFKKDLSLTVFAEFVVAVLILSICVLGILNVANILSF